MNYQSKSLAEKIHRRHSHKEWTSGGRNTAIHLTQPNMSAAERGMVKEVSIMGNQNIHRMNQNNPTVDE